MLPGYANMNNVTVQQAAQGIAVYLLKNVADAASKGIIIGYDGRHHSQEFARLSARVFALKGFKVFLFSQMCGTPFVPYGILKLKCSAGVMVTASHNPKEDNGYKVYGENGALIISPFDTEVSKAIEQNLQLWDLSKIDEDLIVDPLDMIRLRYVQQSVEKLCYHKETNPTTPLKGKIVYTAMHGVGGLYVNDVIGAFGLPLPHFVPSQCKPDPNFPTVTFPNPEETGALDIAMAEAEKIGATLVIATDPDADRLACAEKQHDGKWHVLTGNEIGVLVGEWLWSSFHQKHPEVKPQDTCMLSTAVSSGLLQRICKTEGIIYEETLTGFKWMGNALLKYLADGKHFLFAYEESIGYLCGDLSYDKDGMRTCAIMTECATELARKGKTLVQHLDEIHQKYGFFIANNKYYFCYDPNTMNKIFDEMRHGGKYVESIGRFKVTRIRDLTVGYDSGMPGNKPILPVSKSTQMITYFFENGCSATLRGSGTEPKLKYYIEIDGKYQDKEKITAELMEISHAILETCLRPDHFGLAKPNQ
jgi:Phosphomannomutase